MGAGIVETKDVVRLHPEEDPLEDDLQTEVDEDTGHKNELGDEHRVDVDRGLPKAVVVQRQGHPEGHLGNAQNDGKLHLHGVQKVEFVLGQVPNGVHSKGVGAHGLLKAELRWHFQLQRFPAAVPAATVGLIQHCHEHLLGVGVSPMRLEDAEGLGVRVVVEKASVHGEQAHQEDDVAAAEEHAKDLVTDLPRLQILFPEHHK